MAIQQRVDATREQRRPRTRRRKDAREYAEQDWQLVVGVLSAAYYRRVVSPAALDHRAASAANGHGGR